MMHAVTKALMKRHSRFTVMEALGRRMETQKFHASTRGMSCRVETYSLFKHSFESIVSHGHDDASFDQAADVSLQFQDKHGKRIVARGKVGQSILQIAHRNHIDLEGACESSLACSTCHVILEDSVFHQLEEPTEEEDDLLDMAFGLTTTSRLGCQVIVTEAMDQAIVKLPAATRNFYVDGHVPQPH